MAEEYGMKVWLELAVKNVKEIKKQVESQLKGIDLKGIAGKASAAGGQASKISGIAESLGLNKGIGKLAVIGGAILGALLIIKKGIAQLVKSSPYLQGILSVLGRAMMLFFRPFGDFLGHLLRPLAIALLRLAMKWLKFTRKVTGKGEEEGAVAGIVAEPFEFGKWLGENIGNLYHPL